MMPPFVVFPTNRIAHFVEVSLYLFYLAQRVILTFLHDKGYFISVINPFAMKKYAKNNSIRGAKTDKLDSIMIANYGIEKWFKLQKYEGDEETYAELKLFC